MKKQLLALAMAVLLAGCGGTPAGSPSGAEPREALAMGRYIEEELPLPEGVGFIEGIAEQPDGSVELLCNLNAAEHTGPWMLYTSADGGRNWNRKEATWLDELPGLTAAAPAPDGGWYIFDTTCPAEAENQEEAVPAPTLCRASPAGELEALPLRLPDSLDPEHLSWNLQAAENGDLLLGDRDRTVAQFDAATLEVKNTYDLQSTGDAFLPADGTLYFAPADGGSIRAFDLVTGEQAEGFSCVKTAAKPRGSVSAGFDRRAVRLLAGGGDGAVFLCDGGGVYRRVQGGSVLEKLIDGELTSLSMPSMTYTDLVPRSNGDFLLLCQDADIEDQSYTLLGYRYSGDTPTVPGEELRVYSLRENPTVRETMGLFQRRHPELRVRYTVGITGDSAVTLEDALRTLSAELLAGRGPDLLVLDGLPGEAYIEKGVLRDLSALAGEKSGDGSWMPNIVRALERPDGKLYGIPARYSVPLVLADAEMADAAESFTALAQRISAISREEPDRYAELFPSTTVYSLLGQFLPLSMPGWYRADGSLDEAAFREFLTGLKLLYATGEHSAEDEFIYTDYQIGYGGLSWAYGKAPLALGNLRSPRELAMVDAAIRKRGSGQLLPMFGKGRRLYLPTTIMGVNANSARADAAQAFLELAMSAQVQEKDFEDGLPVNIAAARAGLKSPYTDPEDKMNYGGMAEDGEFMMLTVRWPSEDCMREIFAMLQTLDTPAISDETVAQLAFDELKPCLLGERTEDEVVGSFLQKLALYAAE